MPVLAVALAVLGSVSGATQEASPPVPDLPESGLPEHGLPEPDLSGFEESVAEQLSEVRAMAATVVGNGLVAPAEKVSAWGEMGRLYHAYGLHAAADTCYAQAQVGDPSDPAWPYYRARIAMAGGDLDLAAGFFSRVLDLRPDDGAALVFFADVETGRGRGAEARTLLERAAGLAKVEPVVWARLGEAALAEGRYSEAVELLSMVLEAVPQATRLHHPLGLAYRGLGDMESARTHLAQRGEIGLTPSDPLMTELQTLKVGERVHLLRGRTAFQAGSFAEAAAEFRQAVEAQPESVRARINLSAALARLGDSDGAAQHLQHAVALDAENPTARFNLATLLAAAGEHRLAVAQFAAASRLNSGDEDAWLGEAKSWVALGDFGQAAARLRISNSTLPDSGRIAYALARVLAAAPDLTVRDGARALDLAQRVFDAQRTVEHAVLVSLALREVGRCGEAREWLAGLIAEAQSSGSAESEERLAAQLGEFGDADPCRP